MLNSTSVHWNVKQTVQHSCTSMFVVQSAAVWAKTTMPKHKFFALVLTSLYFFSCSCKRWETLFKAHSAYWTCVTLVKSLQWHKFSSQLNSKLNSQAWSSICNLMCSSYCSSISTSIGSAIQDSICNLVCWSLICSPFQIQFTCWSTWCGDNMIVDVCVN